MLCTSAMYVFSNPSERRAGFIVLVHPLNYGFVLVARFNFFVCIDVFRSYKLPYMIMIYIFDSLEGE
jgi:hypothetical protein